MKEVKKRLQQEKRAIEMERHFIGVISQEKANRLYEIDKQLEKIK